LLVDDSSAIQASRAPRFATDERRGQLLGDESVAGVISKSSGSTARRDKKAPADARAFRSRFGRDQYLDTVGLLIW
jgi:hypothetical protein